MADRVITREMRRQLARDNARQPVELRPVPREEWPEAMPPGLIEVWRSREFLVQVFGEDGTVRLAVCRAEFDAMSIRWRDGITWDELQRIKRECGRGDQLAVEIYPADRDVVNVANMRHLWFPRDPLPFGWRRP